jgi:hypothetical protein
MYKVVRYQSQPGNVTQYFLFNPEMDSIEIKSTMPLAARTAKFMLGSNSTYRADLSTITSLTLHGGHFDHSLDWAISTINLMVSL